MQRYGDFLNFANISPFFFTFCKSFFYCNVLGGFLGVLKNQKKSALSLF